MLLEIGKIRAERFDSYQPHLKQLRFHAFGKHAKERFFIAGNRVGKSLAGANEVAMHLTGLYPAWWPGRRFDKPVSAWAATEDKKLTRDGLQPLYMGDEQLGIKGAIPRHLILSQTAMSGTTGAVDTVRVAHVSGGVSLLGFKSYDQGQKAFQSAKRDIIHLDEEPPEDVYKECVMRVFDLGGCLITTMTPLRGQTELIKIVMSGTSEGIVQNGRVYVMATWADNPFLPTEEKARLRSLYKPHEIKSREQGIPQMSGGMVYPVAEEVICCDPFEIPRHWAQVGGMDFGWTNPTACAKLAYDREADCVYVTAAYKTPELTPQQHTTNLHKIGFNWVPMVGDPAGQQSSQKDGQSLIDLYAQSGLLITPANNSVEAGVMEILQRMRTGRFKVFSNLEDWWSEFRKYIRDAKTSQVVKGDDHLMDATRYGVVSGLAVAISLVQHQIMSNPGNGGNRASGWTA